MIDRKEAQKLSMKKVLPLLAAMMLLFTACSEQAPGQSLEQKGENVQIKQEKQEASSALEKDGMKQIGDSFSHIETLTDENGKEVSSEVEYTIQKVQVFDHYTDAGITEEELSFGYKDTQFVLVEIKAKKLSGPEKQAGVESTNSINFIRLTNKKELEAKAQSGESSMGSPEACYFNGHYEGYETGGGNAYNYWLDVGEEKVFQIGWCLHDGLEAGAKDENVQFLTDTDGLILSLNNLSVSENEYVDLGL